MNNITETQVAIETKARKQNFRGTFKVPTGEFTISRFITQFNLAKSDVKRPTKIGAYLHLRKLLKAGQIEIAGKKKVKKTRGRAQIVYKSCVCETPTITESAAPSVALATPKPPVS